MTQYLERFAARRRELIDSLGIFVGSWGFFLLMIQFPRTRNFDEFHYIPSALQWLGLHENQNWEHPPLAKLLIAVGVGIFGDESFGWRFMSTVSGAFTLVGMYQLGRVLFQDRKHALWVAGLTFLNQLLYVQARIAMLDTFMMAFLVWSLVFLVASLQGSYRTTRYLTYSGALMGLAVACKWFALVAWGTAMGILCLQALQSRSLSRVADIVVCYVFVPAVCYYTTFVPYLFVDRMPPFTLKELLIDAQAKMLDGQKRVVSPHPYMSQWWQWPIMERPIWYAFDKVEGTKSVRGVLLLGNPLIMWGGLVSIAYCLYDFIRRQSAVSFIILAFYGAFTFCWIAIPRKVAFYYYYYPAAMMLSLSLAYMLLKIRWATARYIFLGVALGLFIYFFPILSAMKIPGDGFMKWMWLRSWV